MKVERTHFGHIHCPRTWDATLRCLCPLPYAGPRKRPDKTEDELEEADSAPEETT